MRRMLASALAVAGILAAPGVAVAAADRGVALEPSRIEAVVARGDATPPITITNHTRRPVAVIARPFPATQALSGLPEYESGAAARAAGARLLELDRDRFVLAPGASREVSARVAGCPQTGLGTYAVVEFGVTQAGGGRGGSQVTSALRLVAPLLLESPPRPCLDGRLTELRAEQTGKGRLTFFADVRNTGNLHVRPRTTLRLLRGGRPVFEGGFPMENVIPQARREYALPLTGRLAAGSYRAVATSAVGGHLTRLSRTIQLTGVNTLPTPKLSLNGLRVRDARPGSAPTITATVRSAGTAAAAGTVVLTLRRSGAGGPSDTRTVEVAKLAPGKERELGARLQPLARGSWTLEAVTRTASRETDRDTAGFTVAAGGASAAATARWRDWAATHIDIVFGLVLAALALTAATAVGFARRRRVREAPPAESSAELAAIRSALARMEAEAARHRAPGARAASARRTAAPDGDPGFVARSEPAPPPPAPAPPPSRIPPAAGLTAPIAPGPLLRWPRRSFSRRPSGLWPVLPSSDDFLDPRDGPRDECGVFGIFAPEHEVARLAYFSLYALQHRGQESAGIAASQGGHIMAMRDQGLVNQVFDEQKLRALQGDMAIGHVRYSTTGANSWENSQPVWRADQREVALAHNGNLINAVELHGELRGRRRRLPLDVGLRGASRRCSPRTTRTPSRRRLPT